VGIQCGHQKTHWRAYQWVHQPVIFAIKKIAAHACFYWARVQLALNFDKINP
jgi:hypothetical protein